MGQNSTIANEDGIKSASDVISPNSTTLHRLNFTYDRGGNNELFSTPEFRIAFFLIDNNVRAFFAIGLLGNILTFLILMRRRPLTPWNFYIVVLTVSDNLVLLVKLIATEMLKSQSTIENTRDFCKLFLFFGMTFAEFSHWVIVCMTVERFVVVWFPLRINGSNVRRAYCLVTILAVLLPCNNITYFWFKGDQWNPVTYCMCDPDSEYDEFVTQYWRWIRATVYGYIPLSVVLLANTLILLGWMVSNRRHRKLTRPGRKMTITVEDVSKHVQLTMMVTSVSVSFALVVIPHMVYTHKDNPNFLSPDTPKAFLLFTLSVALTDLNYCCTFFLYSTTSSEFRKELKLLFRKFLNCKLVKHGVNCRKATNLSNMTISHFSAQHI